MKYQITLALHKVDENKRGRRKNEIMRQIRKAGTRGEEWRGEVKRGEERRGEENREGYSTVEERRGEERRDKR